MNYNKFKSPHIYSTYDNDAKCSLCNNVGSYLIRDQLYCDNCVQNGMAYSDLSQRNKTMFVMDLADHPPIRKWQDWDWPQCCDEVMIYVCELSKETIRSYSGILEPDQFIEKCMPGSDDGQDLYECLRDIDRATDKTDYELMLHLFSCHKCQRQFIKFDAS